MPKSTIITEEEAIERIKRNFPKTNFTIIDYETAGKPFIIKCNKCGKIQKVNNLNVIMGRINFCSCEKEFENTKEKVLFLLEKTNFELIEWKGSGKKTKIRCKKCLTEIERFPSEILKHSDFCPECNNSQTKPMTLEQIQEKIDKSFPTDKYILLNYENWKTKVNIKHLKCNTIFNQSIGHFLDGCGCPKCYRKRSKGEKIIEDWLLLNNITHETQFRIDYPDKTRGYFDFYMKDKKMAIEYNGEQHYDENNTYNKKNCFKKQIERDQKKRQYCIDNNIKLLEIPYWSLKEIPNILSSEFNDYPIKEQDSSESEAFSIEK